MSLHLMAKPEPLESVRQASAFMRPITFDNQFGWLHAGSGPQRETGVILLAPLGRDARCAHRPTRLLADQLAAEGFATLRYDHRGCGDSLDLDSETANALPVWLEGVEQAIATLRAQTGVRRVVIGGVRLGATLAALAADKADGLILLAPVLSGRSWLRRLRFSSDVARDRQAAGGDADPVDTDGLELSAATAAALAAVDLDQVVIRTKAFVAAQNRLVDTYAKRLGDWGCQVSNGDFPGFRELFLDAHSNLPPVTLHDRIVQWMATEFAPLAEPKGARGLAPAAPAQLRPPGALETAVTFGEGLQGVYCRPETGTPATTVLFCNTGGDPRSGIGGFATRAARRLAQTGVASLRFDFAGLGDSPLVDEEGRSHVFETPREADFNAALAFLEDQGRTDLVAVGVCAGAYHALHLAWRDARIGGVFAVSPVKLVWSEGDSLIFGRKDDGKATQVYAKAAADPETWKRLLAGRIDLATVSRTLVARLKDRAGALGQRRSDASPLSQMQRLLRRGGRACLVMGLDDASLDEVETHLGPKGGPLARSPNASILILPRLDHGLARRESRDTALDCLVQWLGSAAEQAWE